MAYHRCNDGRTLITYCVCGRDATIDESSIIDSAVTADRARIAAAIRKQQDVYGESGHTYQVLDRLLRVVEGG